MNKLYAPWRSQYEKGCFNGCAFCIIFEQNNDEKNFILKRTQNCVIMLNLYPYNAGHVMVLPKMHKANIYDFDSATKLDLIESISLATKAIEVLNPDGLNIGTNQGKSAGGSIPEHLHIHILPRWAGDTNFLCVFDETKLISFDLNEIYKKLLPSFK